MDKKKFESLLILIVPQIVRLIVEKYNIDEIAASDMLYNSKLYETLEEEETKLWHLSPLALFDMFVEEKETGTIIFPEEA